MKITKVLLAAGQSTRFGECKLTQPIGSTCMVRNAVQILNAINDEPTYVISGAWHKEVSNALSDIRDVKIIRNEQWQKGLGNSIAFAAKKLGHANSALLFVLADQVALTCDDLRKLLLRFEQDPTRWCAYYDQCFGVPAIFPAEDRLILQELDGKYGAKKLLCDADVDVKVQSLNIPNAAFDIDTHDDLAHAQHLLVEGDLSLYPSNLKRLS